jgi:hypothetical protein
MAGGGGGIIKYDQTVWSLCFVIHVLYSMQTSGVDSGRVDRRQQGVLPGIC